jgi:hypothetical protein
MTRTKRNYSLMIGLQAVVTLLTCCVSQPVVAPIIKQTETTGLLSTLTPDNLASYLPFSYSRPAGDGIIIEDSFTPLHSEYRIKNQWRFVDNNKITLVYAGGVLKGDVGGDALQNELSWRGILVVRVYDADQQVIRDETGIYYTPTNAGPVRIVNAIGKRLTLVARDGTYFIFDVSTRLYLVIVTKNPLSHPAGAGLLIESGNTPFPVEGYRFENNWFEEKQNVGILFAMAGEQTDEQLVDTNR